MPDLKSDPERTESRPEPMAVAHPATRSSSRLRWLHGSSAVGASLTFLVFMGVFAFYALWLGARFSGADARLLDVHQNVPLLLVSLGLCLCLASGQFDLSVGGMVTLTCYLTVGLTIKQQWPFAVVLLAVVVVAVAAGAINAILVVIFRVNAFIATLGTGAILAGLSNVYSGGTQLAPTASGPMLPAWFSGQGSFGSFQTKAPLVATWVLLACALVLLSLLLAERLAGVGHRTRLAVAVGVPVLSALILAGGFSGVLSAVPWTVLFLLMVLMAAYVALHYTAFGRYLYATGGNAEAASLAGVRTRRITSSAFVLSSLLAGTAGIVLAGIQGSASPDLGAGLLLPAYAAAFLSTVLLSTGRFHVWGTVVGGIFLIWVSQGLVVGGVSFTWTGVVNGVVLVAAVSLSTALRRGDRR